MSQSPRKLKFESGTPLPEQKAKTYSKSWITDWNPEDPDYWEKIGKKIARRNLAISVAALVLAFVVWMVWSSVVVELPNIGFNFSTNQLFWLAALPGLSGATFRIFYSFMVPIVGGRNWTVLTTASLMLPMASLGFAVQDTETPFLVFASLAVLCGFGGGNFASSMANINFFFPKKIKGTALGLNGGLGNLGVSAVQFLTPFLISTSLFSTLGGQPQKWANGTVTKQLWMQNAAWAWIPLIAAAMIAAWFGMNNLTSAKSSFKDQSTIFKRKHTWVTSLLYLASFGSFIGYSAALPLLIKTEFSDISPLKYAFIGPLVGALARAFGGWLADRVGGAKVTATVYLSMILSAFGVLYFLNEKAFAPFLAMFTLLFFFSGLGNGSIYRMVPLIFSKKYPAQATHESAAALGFISAVSAYGAFIIPKSFGYSMSQTGSVQAAFVGFIFYYFVCFSLTWWFYFRKNSEVSC